ncbi:elongator complex protein 4-like isoform X2 [Artemia franciscana]|uniref:elongator complex protein 4-like isoform X2 n=1 Tax=Artemia franciscana TaxID=6661 RepID=UPI0032DBAA2A
MDKHAKSKDKDVNTVNSGNNLSSSVNSDGIPVGGLAILIEDTSAYLARNFAHRFLVEGQRNGHENLFCSLNHEMLEETQSSSSKSVPIGVPRRMVEEKEDELKIAWRYKNLPKVSEGHAHMEETKELSSFSPIEIWETKQDDGGDKYTELLKAIYSKAKCFQVKPGDVGEKNVLRVAMVSLGTSLWGKENLLKFLVLLKNVLRVSCASCLVTIPSFVVKLDSKLLSSIRNLSDIYMALQDIDPDVHEELKVYSAVMHLDFPNTLNAFHVNYPDTKDLAVKISRNQLVVEKVHLTPGIRVDERKPVSRVDF